MSKYHDKVEELTTTLHMKERQLNGLRKFESTGGEHRLRITSEHPDYEVHSAVEAVCKTANAAYATLLLKGLLKIAEDEVSTARSDLSTYILTAEESDKVVKP